MTDRKEFEMKWKAPEFEYREKDVAWYWMTIIVAVLAMSIAVWQRNFLFGFFIIVAEILLLVWGSQKPKTIEFSFDARGLTINKEKFYPFSEFQNFSTNNISPEKSKWVDVYFQFSHQLRPSVRIRAPQRQIYNIQKVLSLYLPEREFEESFVDTLEKFTRF